MRSKSQRLSAALALLVVFAITQVGVSFAGPTAARAGANPGENLAAPPQQFTAILTTRGNKAISVNGASAISGATILTGTTIETPDQVGATINLGSLGTLEIAPNTKLSLEFDANGNVKVTLVQGCTILHTKKNTNGEIDTSQGVAGKTDKSKAGLIDVCFPPGATSPVVNVGAAASAGAGAGSTAVAAAAAGGGGGLFGLGTAATIAIIAGGTAAVAIPLATRGRNPSPATP